MDLQKIEALLKLLSEHEVNEFQFKDADIELSLNLGARYVAAPVAPVAVAEPAPVAAAPAPVAAAPAAPAADEGLVTIESPMVGTFYRSSSPGAAPYVDAGAAVRPGQVLCIIEAMKLMNEIESEVAGTIVEICVQNAQPVQFGQPLFKIRPA
jgi:acetyl-CoA carboxylase biotin carboxyl carrier protein